MSKKLPQGWKESKLGDIATYVNGKAFKPSEWSERGTPIVRIQNLTDENKPYNYYAKDDIPEKYIINDGDILISWSASLGVFEWNKGYAFLNQHIFKVIFDKIEINKKYFVYIVRDKLLEMERHTHGSTMKHITKGNFDKMSIVLPPLEEQERIVFILERAEDAIRKREESNRLLDEYLKSVFVDMFGDPVTNPKGWDKGTIRDLVVEVKYGSSKKADEFNGQFPILRMNNITYQGNWDFRSLKYIDLEEKEQEKYLAYKGDMLFNRTNSKELVGKTAVYREENPIAYAGYLVRVRANEKANTEFISAYLNSDYCKEVLQNMCKNIVGMANINAQEMQEIKIYMPPIELQNRFLQIVYGVEAIKKKNINSNKKLNNLFNSLMQRAFSGEL